MKKSVVVIFILITFFSSKIIFPQNSGTFEFSGGMLLNSSASNGFNAMMQYNYYFNESTHFYN